MDIEKLIERLKCPQIHSCPMNGDYPSCKACQKDIKQNAATALSTLQAENEKLRAELEKVKKALAMMWFAYGNKDGEFPHEYEIEAMKTAEEILGSWEECMPKYLRRRQKED